MKQMPTILIIFSILLLSCLKKEKDQTSANDDKFQIIEALNQGDSQKALKLATKGRQQNPQDFEYYYFEAQAYSQKAQVDVYSLFPLMKMKVFDVALTEWRRQEEFEKKRKKQLEFNLLGENGNASNANAEELEKIRYEISETEVMDFPIVVVSESGETYEHSSFCYLELKITSPYFVNEEETVSRTFYHERKNEDGTCNSKSYSDLTETDRYGIKSTVKVRAWEMVNEKIENREQRQIEERYAKALFALYDSLPILKKAPTLTSENAEFAIVALEKLDTILKQNNISKRLKENATQQSRLLALYLIIGSYKNTTDLDTVVEVADLVCSINPFKTLQHYRYFHQGAKYFMRSMKNSELAKKNWETYIEYLEKVETAPETLTEEENEEYIDDIQDFKEDRSC